VTGKQCRLCFFSVQPKGLGMFVCHCAKSPHFQQTVSGMINCREFRNVNDMVLQLNLKDGELRTIQVDGEFYQVHLNRGIPIVYSTREVESICR
jgi:hypothetical protein